MPRCRYQITSSPTKKFVVCLGELNLVPSSGLYSPWSPTTKVVVPPGSLTSIASGPKGQRFDPPHCRQGKTTQNVAGIQVPVTALGQFYINKAGINIPGKAIESGFRSRCITWSWITHSKTRTLSLGQIDGRQYLRLGISNGSRRLVASDASEKNRVFLRAAIGPFSS